MGSVADLNKHRRNAGSVSYSRPLYGVKQNPPCYEGVTFTYTNCGVNRCLCPGDGNNDSYHGDFHS